MNNNNNNSSIGTLFVCASIKCGQTFSTLISLKEHLSNCRFEENKEEESLFKCDVDGCDKEFEQRKQLYNHKYNAHRLVKSYNCNLCEFSFATPSKLKRHTKQHFGYPCQIDGCTVLSKTVNERRKHRATCHKTEIAYKCDRCAISFCDGKSFKKHQGLHEYLVKCDQVGCNVEFFPRHRAKHMKECHKNQMPADERRQLDVLPYTCDECQKQFSKALFLKKHQKLVHSAKPNNERPKKFVCPVDDCGRNFLSTVKWESHVNWHNNEKPYKCPVNECLNSFAGKMSLQRHLRQKHLTTLKQFSDVNQLFTDANANFPAESLIEIEEKSD